MIRVKRPPVPKALVASDSAGATELAKAREFFSKKKNGKKSFPFKAYKDDSVKGALEQAFHRKCAYCEALYEGVHPVDIEHFRPKAGFVRAGGNGGRGKLETPGYWWLAMSWKNLLPSCIDCNRARTQEFEGQPPHVSGKANQFPLADESSRARKEGEHRFEERLLLDPCADYPEKHLVFDDDGHVDPVRDGHGRLSRKGVASIEVYGLDRDEKVRARRRVMTDLTMAMHAVQVLVEVMDAHPGEERWEQKVAVAHRHLLGFAAPEHEFAGMCRQAIDRFERSLTA